MTVLSKAEDTRRLKTAAALAAIITAVLVIPPFLWDIFISDGTPSSSPLTIVDHGVFSFVAAAVAAYFSPFISPFIKD